MEIIPYDRWYLKDGVFESRRVLNGWVDRLQKALGRGFSGMRVTGNTFWLEKGGWRDFLDYEEEVNRIIGQQSIIALCTYSIDRCDAGDVLDVVGNHHFALSKREGEWKIIESEEQKDARKALRESEVRFRSLIQNASDIIRILDWEGRIIFDSPSSERILGYPHGFLEGKPALDFVHPDDRELVQQSLGEVCDRTNPGTPTEFRIRRADGGYLDVESTGVNMLGVPGVDGIVITTRPITERKRAEEALRDSERKFRAIFDQTFQFAGLMAPDGTLTEANQSALKLVGAEEADVTGKPFWSTPWWTHSKALTEEVREAVKRAAEGEFVRFEATHRAADGSLRYVDFSIKPVWDESGRVVLLIPEGRDITERKRAEEALKYERSQLLSIFDSIDEAIYIADPETYEILYANKAMQDKFGKDPVGRTCYREFQGREAPCAFCTNALILKKKGEPYRWEFHNPLLDRDFLIVDRIIKWPDGRDVRFELAIDITGRKRVEKDLNEAKARAELYLDLMGHDINNMHQIALGYLELAKELDADPSREELLDKPVEVLQRSARLIQNVRKLQKLHDGAFEDREVDVCAVLADVRREFGAVPHKTITLDTRGHNGCRVRANELLYDVFANLVSNAIKHTGSGANIAIALDAGADGGRRCRVTVEDEGPGIPDDFKPVIFDRMLKGTAHAKGIGLGLYLVKSLVDSYGGKVWVEDRVAGDHTRGAKFVVTLPTAERDEG